MREPCSNSADGEGKVWTVADLTGGLVSCWWQTHPKHLKDTPSSYKCFEFGNFKSELNKERSAAIACSQTHSYFYLVHFFKVNCVFHKGYAIDRNGVFLDVRFCFNFLPWRLRKYSNEEICLFCSLSPVISSVHVYSLLLSIHVRPNIVYLLQKNSVAFMFHSLFI